jgi:flagellar hook-length control protein FliK
MDAGPSSQLENFLQRELHNGLNGDIVRQAEMVLRDKGEGTVRLQLKPAELGNVRIKLNLGDKGIVSGKIIVETPEALKAFESELDALREAFVESGFSGAELSMQLAGGDAGSQFENLKAMAEDWAASRDLAQSAYEGNAKTVTATGPTSIRTVSKLDVLV